MRDPHIASLDYISLENMLSRHCEKAQTMSCQAILQGAVKKQKRKEDRQTKKWEDNKKNCTWLELVDLSEQWNIEKGRRTHC